jgi:ribonucleotide monophosphatase NagD (HAD superfamily)
MRGANLAAAFTVHSSFADIAARYNGFILDQFGVMHNGKHALDGASECVKRLHQDDKKCVILSNTSSLSQSTLDQLPNLGFDPSHFRGAVTSGEEASRYISQTFGRQPNNNEKQRNNTALWITWDKQKKPDPLDFFAACGNIDPTCEVEDADFILLHGCQTIRGKESEVCSSLGSFMETGQLDDIDPILKQCQKRGLPMVCANPDFIVVMSDGSTGHMPGKFYHIFNGSKKGMHEELWFQILLFLFCPHFIIHILC